MNGTQVLGRALDILFVLGESERTLSVCEIAEKVAIPESTAYRLLQTLEQNGIVERKAKGQIGLGLRILDLARNLHQQIDHELIIAAREVMEQLTEKTNETSLLAFRTGLQAICIDCVESPRFIRFTIPKGKILPLHKGASGKAILAYENKRILEQLTHASKDSQVSGQLDKELGDIVQNGYSMTIGEVDMDVCGIAAPIYDGYRRVIASLTVVGPIDRFPKEARDQAIVLVMESAREISEKLAKLKR
ncbi:IclR family transcriptional regulator [Cohnella pontilimi]|uniref:IclR family transcriptional regulator n=1 Tax=Cohnella pontilimi TaxID=2564100 RepID=A0A4U0F7J6_9BACL|nr:IclR family transcriptional regulator [Cohnella pontilimi]TJY40687.1 IclR family transcriptional regulator [Cohnella pontilimi]